MWRRNKRYFGVIPNVDDDDGMMVKRMRKHLKITVKVNSRHTWRANNICSSKRLTQFRTKHICKAPQPLRDYAVHNLTEGMDYNTFKMSIPLLTYRRRLILESQDENDFIFHFYFICLFNDFICHVVLMK